METSEAWDELEAHAISFEFELQEEKVLTIRARYHWLMIIVVRLTILSCDVKVYFHF